MAAPAPVSPRRRTAAATEANGGSVVELRTALTRDGRTVEVNEYGLPVIWTYEQPSMRQQPSSLQFISVHIFKLFLIATFGGSLLILVIAHCASTERTANMLGISVSQEFLVLCKYISIPLVCILFTWWHVWLGIKMCFYPVEFVGCCSPVCGWQGIVPRRAEIMASRSCDIMIGSLLTIEEIIGRIDPESFFSELESVIVDITDAVVQNIAKGRCPEVWEKLPDSVKLELRIKIMETAPSMFTPVLNDLKANANKIVDVKAMSIEILVNNKKLLVDMFEKIGTREFTFIQHFSAVLGFFLGVIQMLLWLIINYESEDCEEDGSQFHCWAGFVMLPVSGLIIGYLTNWLGINLIFRPIEPHIFCGGRFNFQGVFLKRQTEVAHEIATVVCERLVTARRIIEFISSRPEVVKAVVDLFSSHVEKHIDMSVGKIVRAVSGRRVMNDLKCDVIALALEELPGHSKKIEDYMDRQFNLAETMSYRLSHLQPADFEGMLHPVFQEDEWMLLLLGGVLGVLVGILQAFFLGA